jgi:hypothetical protein
MVAVGGGGVNAALSSNSCAGISLIPLLNTAVGYILIFCVKL